MLRPGAIAIIGMVHQRRFWGNTRGLSADLGRGPKQVEKTHSNRLKKYHAERRCQKRWGPLAIRGPFRCKHRIKHRKRRPGHQGPRVGAACPATTVGAGLPSGGLSGASTG